MSKESKTYKNMAKKIYIRTFGCQMNEHDSTRMVGILAPLGFVPTPAPEGADLILFNTCTVREKAHHKAMSEIGRARVYKRQNASTLIGVCGCVAQEERESLFARYPHVDLLFGPDQISKLPELIDEVREKGKAAALELVNNPTLYHFIGPRATSHEPRATAFVSIMKGCNSACSYCIVPKVRGREVCRDPDDIVEEVRRLASSGTKEVTLLGQNVNAYEFRGRRQEAGDTKGHTPFAALLRRIAQETEITRIRFTSPHPKDVGDDLIREYAENEKLMPHIHLPVQAGCNATLKRMLRGYTREEYIEICGALRRVRPGMAITTDIIVGFPGETSAHFEETVALIREVEFDSCFAFKYSPRPGTLASEKCEDDVPRHEKERRLDEVLSIQREMTRARNLALVGSVSEALVTGLDRMGRGLVTGRLPDNRIVHFTGQAGLIGAIVPVRITKAGDNSLRGEMYNG